MNYKLTDIIPLLKEDITYEVPADAIGHSSEYLPRQKAINRLTSINKYWQGQGKEIVFGFGSFLKNIPVWNKDKYEQKDVQRITIHKNFDFVPDGPLD